MSGCSRKFFVVIAALSLAIIPMSVMALNDDSNADSTVDYTKYYYDQLGDFSRTIYDAVLNMGPNDTSRVITVNEAWFDTSSSVTVNDQIGNAVSAAQKALICDNDLNCSSWLNLNSGIDYTMLGSNKMPKTITITVEEYEFPGSTTSLSARSAVNNAVKVTGIENTDDREALVTEIHDYVVSELAYPSSDHMSDPLVRSVWNSFCGDYTVVCEGYAKMFHALCNYYGIPCIIVSGLAKGDLSESAEGHMWTYVQMDDEEWYLVDPTWDDQAEVEHTYLLAGTQTMGFTIKIGDSYSISEMTKAGFTLPELSKARYNDPSQQYTVSLYLEKTGEIYKSENVYINMTMDIPSNPHMDGMKFVKWLNADTDDEWDFNTPVKKNTKLYAEWTATSDPVFDTVFDSNGGNEKISSVQTNSGEQFKITDMELTREGYEFKGWNTGQNGTGVTFEPGATISVSKNMTLYAIWESTEEQPIDKIDSTIQTAGDFLKDEKIEGVSNTVLTIGIIAGVLTLIAVILIARKE